MSPDFISTSLGLLLDGNSSESKLLFLLPMDNLPHFSPFLEDGVFRQKV